MPCSTDSQSLIHHARPCRQIVNVLDQRLETITQLRMHTSTDYGHAKTLLAVVQLHVHPEAHVEVQARH